MRALTETRRYWLPVAVAVLCLLASSLGLPPVVAYVLIMAAFGLCFDAVTAWFARANGTGGMSDYKQ